MAVEISSPPVQRTAWGRIIAWVVLILLLTVVGIALVKAQQGQFGVGQVAPDFAVTTFDGQQVSLQDLRGKVVLLNFWASWCIPCAQEAAELEQAWQLYKDRGDVVFLGVAWSDMDTKAIAYLKKYQISFPNAPDMGTRASQAYRITGVPETYIIDRNGVMAYVKFSPFESVAEIQTALDTLLAAK